MAIRVKFGWLEPLGRLGRLGPLEIIRPQTPNYALCIMHLIKRELEFDDGDAGAAELDMFVVEFLHARHRPQVLAD